MLLAIDVGNSNTVFGMYKLGSNGTAAEMLANWRMTTPSGQTTDEFGTTLRSLFAQRGFELSVVDGIVVSSVVPPLDWMLRQVCEVYFKVKPLFVEPGVRTGLPILTDNPSEVGADRIVNCVAAIDLFRQSPTNNGERSTVNACPAECGGQRKFRQPSTVDRQPKVRGRSHRSDE